MVFGVTTQPAPAAQAGAPANHGAIETIVIVDDDDLVAETLAANMEDAGFRAAWFTDGPAALAYLEEGGPASAILLDWSMPQMDGPEVLRRLRRINAQAPVLFLTGHTQPMFEETALANGAVDFVDKSRSFSIVLQRLKLALAGAKGPAEMQPQSATGLRIDDASARAFWSGKPLGLTISEFKVVRLLATQAGRDVSYRAIYDEVRGEGFLAGAGQDGYRANVRAMVKRIRRTFCAVDPSFDAIKNYAGFGYRWCDDRPPARAA